MRHSSSRNTRLIREERLQADPDFRAYWARTALARAVANRIIDYRIKHKLTQSQLARILGIRQPAVARLEVGEHNPSWETLNLLSGRLGISFLVGISPADNAAIWESAGVADFLTSATTETIDSPTENSRSLIAIGSGDRF